MGDTEKEMENDHAAALDRWVADVSYSESRMRADARLSFTVRGITDGNTLMLNECIDCDPNTITDDDIVRTVEKVGFRVSDGCFYTVRIEWGYDQGEDAIYVNADLHLAEPDMDDMNPEVSRIDHKPITLGYIWEAFGSHNAEAPLVMDVDGRGRVSVLGADCITENGRTMLLLSDMAGS